MTRRFRNVGNPHTLMALMEEIRKIIPIHVEPDDLIRMIILFISNYAMDSRSAEEILTYALEDVRDMYDKWGDRNVITCEVWQ